MFLKNLPIKYLASFEYVRYLHFTIIKDLMLVTHFCHNTRRIHVKFDITNVTKCHFLKLRHGHVIVSSCLDWPVLLHPPVPEECWPWADTPTTDHE